MSEFLTNDEEFTSFFDGTRWLEKHYFTITPKRIKSKPIRVIKDTMAIDIVSKELYEYLLNGTIPKSSIAQYHVSTRLAKDDS